MGILPVRARRSQSAGLRGTAKQRVGACARGGAKEDLAAGCIQVSASVISYRRVCRQSVEPQAPRLKTCPPFAFPKTIARCYAVGVCVCEPTSGLCLSVIAQSVLCRAGLTALSIPVQSAKAARNAGNKKKKCYIFSFLANFTLGKEKKHLFCSDMLLFLFIKSTGECRIVFLSLFKRLKMRGKVRWKYWQLH